MPSVRVPFVPCKSDGQVGPLTVPAAVEKYIEIDPNLAVGLAYYQSGVGPGLLAPSGWFCFGAYGSSGSTFLVTRQPISGLSDLKWPLIGPVVELDRTSGDTSGRFEVAQVVARVFPKYKALVLEVIKFFGFFEQEITYGPFSTDQLTYRGDRMVEYRTPPNTEGLGTLTKRLGVSGDAIEGVAMLQGKDPDLLLLSVRLPSEMKGDSAPIIRYLEHEAGYPPR